MTRKDYEAFATAIRNMPDGEDKATFIRNILPIFSADNPRFDAATFRHACRTDTDYRNRSRATALRGAR